jgi:hypothetical protein
MDSSRNDTLYIYIPISLCGYIAPFSSIDKVVDFMKSYPKLPYIIHKFIITDEKSEDIWVVPYTGSGAIAFASSSQYEAKQLQEFLVSVGLVHSDDIDFYKRKKDVVCQFTMENLEIYQKLLSEDEEFDKKMNEKNEALRSFIHDTIIHDQKTIKSEMYNHKKCI